jgi:drug/metabolite transporter (DMT)-like permease
MLGIVFALSSALAAGIEKILHRFVCAREDSLSYAFIWHLLSGILLLPIFILEFKLPSEPSAWNLVLVSSLLWTIVAYIGFKAYSYLDVSVLSPIVKSKLFFVLFFSAIFLRESLSVGKIVGTVLIFIGVMIISYKRRSGLKDLKRKGVLLVLASSLTISVALLIDKYATNFFNLGMYSFLVYSIPVVLLIPFVANKKAEIKSVIRNRFPATLATVLLGTTYYYLMLRAFRLAEASIVVPIVQSSTIIAVLGGIIFLKERTDIPKKVLAALIVIAGALLVSGTYNL